MEDEIVLKRRLDGTDEPKDLPLALLQKITNGFAEERKIGQGGFGAVYKGELGNVIVAVKRIYVNLDKLDIDDKLFDREFNSLWKINHENVVRFLGFCSNTCRTPIKDARSGEMILANVRERLFCFEYICGGSLDKHITDELRGLEWETRYEIITGICKGLCYLHNEKNIVHMDLKPENILLYDLLVPKLTDFGLSRPNKNSHTRAQPIGTLGYIAPEYMEDSKTTPACDIYSLGLIIIELITGNKEVPHKNNAWVDDVFYGVDVKLYTSNVLRRWRHRWNNPPTPIQCQQVTGCIDIAVRCREQDPKARPSINDIIELLSKSTDGHTGQEISTYLDDDMLGIEPLQLDFSSEKSLSVKLTNKTKASYAFKIKRPSKQYTIQPDKGIVRPECTEYIVQITLQPQKSAPQVTQNAEEFVVQSRIVSNGHRVEDITKHFFHQEAGKVVDNVNLVVVYEPTKPLKISKSREDTNMPAEEVPEMKKRKIAASASEKGKNKLGSSDISEAASMDINLSRKGQPIGQTEQYNLHTLQSFSRHYPTNRKYLGKESRAVDLTRGAMGRLLDKLGKLVTEDYNLGKSIKSDIESFSEDLTIIHRDLPKLENVDEAKIWVDEVRELSYNIEDMVDNFLVHVEPDSSQSGFRELRHEGLNLLVNGMPTHNQIDDVIRDVKNQIQAVADRKEKYKFNVNNVVANSAAKAAIDPRISGMYIDREQLVGIEEQINEILRLFEGDDDVSMLKIVSIVGLGGLGKTTLAKAVYDTVKEYRPKAFVLVGQNPVLKAVLKKIIIGCTTRKYNAAKLEFLDDQQLIDELQKVLKNKRYFIVIDDLWDYVLWDTINSAFPKNDCCSRVITTTRNLDVVDRERWNVANKVYKIKPLSYEDSRTLFFTRTFGPRKECPPRKEDISKYILKRCGGMPLAINSIASHLARDATDSTWEYVSKSLGAINGNDIEQMKQILDLSYIHLPAHLKTCLLHVCMYPEDWEIDKNDLLRQWVAEGFVSAERGHDAEDIAEEYFKALIDNFMIQPGKIDYYNNEVLSCRVHDIILDLMRSKSSELNFSLVIDGSKDETGESGKIRRVSVHPNDEEDMRIFEQIKNKVPLKHVRFFPISKKKLKHVRSVLLYRELLVPYFVGFNYVRVLHLEYKGVFGGLLDLTGISRLFLLKYLKIANSGWICGDLQLPDQIGELQQLETIDLKGCLLKNFPSSIVSLPRLSHLRYISDFGLVLPDGIGRMKSLRTLGGVCVFKSSVDTIEGLGELTNLRSLEIHSIYLTRSIEKIDVRMKALESSISRLHSSLRVLTMSTKISFENPLDLSGSKNLFPQGSHIRKLDLRGRNFHRCPEWISQLHDLYSFRIQVREVADSLSIVASLPSLAYFCLHIESFTGEKEESAVFPGSGSSSFTALKHLRFHCKMVSLTFQEGAVPKLEKLGILFPHDMTRRFLPVGIEHLPSGTFKKISLSVDKKTNTTGSLLTELTEAFMVHHPGAEIVIHVQGGSFGKEYDDDEDAQNVDNDDGYYEEEEHYEEDGDEQDDGCAYQANGSQTSSQVQANTRQFELVEAPPCSSPDRVEPMVNFPFDIPASATNTQPQDEAVDGGSSQYAIWDNLVTDSDDGCRGKRRRR